MKILIGFLSSLILGVAVGSQAATDYVTVGELLNFANQSKERDDFTKLIAQKMEDEFIKSEDLTIANGSIWINNSFPNMDYESRDLCVRLSIHGLNGSVTLGNSSRLDYVASKLTAPVDVNLDTTSYLKTTGKVSKTVGLFYPVPDPTWLNPGRIKMSCTFSARVTDTTNIEIGANISANFKLSLNVNPTKQYSTDDKIVLR